MDVLKDRHPCSPEAVGALVDLVRGAFARSGTLEQVDTDDIELLVEALHLMRPGRVEFSFFDGWLHMVRKEWSEAEALFRDLAERSVCVPASRGMLLQCLKAQRSHGWQDEARKLIEEEGDDEVRRLARVLLAGEDLTQAVATAKRTGRFVAPESALALENGARADEGDGAGTALSQTNSEMLLEMQYMRI